MTNQQVFSATIFFAPENGIRPRKYSYVRSLPGFASFAAKCGGIYVNVYTKPDGLFYRRIWL